MRGNRVPARLAMIGGLVAIWEGDERCGGYCSSGHVQLKLSVTPIPGT